MQVFSNLKKREKKVRKMNSSSGPMEEHQVVYHTCNRICESEVSEGREENIFKDMIAEIFLNLIKNIDLCPRNKQYKIKEKTHKIAEK